MTVFLHYFIFFYNCSLLHNTPLSGNTIIHLFNDPLLLDTEIVSHLSTHCKIQLQSDLDCTVWFQTI